jgi:osmotically-inducible protein OsmY
VAAKSEGTDIADGWITTKVKSTYMYSTNVNGSDIAVSTNAGVVTLTGKVDSGAERALAIELAHNVRGVKSVDSTALTM